MKNPMKYHILSPFRGKCQRKECAPEGKGGHVKILAQ